MRGFLIAPGVDSVFSTSSGDVFPLRFGGKTEPIGLTIKLPGFLIIEAVGNEIEPLESTLCEAVRKQSRLSLLINGDYCLLDTRKKAVMDAFRVMASNIFRNVQERFRVIYDNFRDDHAMVRVISRSSGTVRIKPDAVIFTIWLPGSLQPYQLRHIETLLAEIQRSINNEIPARRSVILKLKTGPQPI